ncbi:MAG: dihydroorotate dehydrogenase electron transfer subunit, partial [Candidatus Aminicenantes bacterium]|nr:dihydroorotate dehydrogenase electron transfer subunit [Candidatus Aminicenantes bacterium]
WDDFHLLRLESPGLAAGASPGQFLMIRTAGGNDPLLRRPISLHDAGPDWLEVFFRVAGRGTALLAEKKEGETADCLGPLGKGFRLDGFGPGKTAWLIGGGRGIAPMFFLGRELRSRGTAVRVFYGGKTAAEIPLRGKFEAAGLETSCSTDDGSFGFSGFVTALLERELEKEKPDGIFACGPDPMMKRAAGPALDRNIPAQLSLEAVMGCGFGACWGCVHRIRKDGEAKWRKVCEDGPVFDARDVAWEET